MFLSTNLFEQNHKRSLFCRKKNRSKYRPLSFGILIFGHVRLRCTLENTRFLKLTNQYKYRQVLVHLPHHRTDAYNIELYGCHRCHTFQLEFVYLEHS